MPQHALAGIVLAAGKGTRMKSDKPKALFEVCGAPMAELAGRAMREAGVQRPILVVGFGGDLVRSVLGEGYDYAEQSKQLGTGHATRVAAPFLQGFDGSVLVCPGDAPLVTGEALLRLVSAREGAGAACALASSISENPSHYGRVIRDDAGQVIEIIEAKDASQNQLAVAEINASAYCFDCSTLLRLLPLLDNENRQGEYYLTDLIKMIAMEGGKVVAEVFDDQTFMGVNDRWELALAATHLRERILKSHAKNGVTIIDPATSYIGVDVKIGRDTTIRPMTSIAGLTRIGHGCELGPSSDINDSTIEDGCIVLMSKLDHVTMGPGSRCGPYAHLRRGTTLGAGAKVGNYVEVKNAILGEKAAAGHLTYIGDAEIGSGTNVGAGTITCNYDGFAKHRTEIGENAFIGSNSTLVAPVTIGDGAIIAAGSTITEDVPAEAMGIGRGRQEVKLGWAARWRQRKQAQKK